MAPNAAAVIKIASGEVGYHEGKSGGHWNNAEKYAAQVPGLAWANYQAWCCTFTSWVAYKAGAGSLYPSTASCLAAVAWFKKAGRFSAYPAVGAQVFYGPGGGTHTGIVESYTADTITTIEGNTNTNGSAEGDGVYRKVRQRRDSYVYGYGYPKFAEGIKSADPAYAKEAPKAPVKAPAPAKPVVSVAHINAARAKDIPAATGHKTYPAEVKLVEAALAAEGLLSKQWVDGSWGTKTDDAFNAHRRRMGLTGSDATGSVGIKSLSALGSKHGFTVKA